jgi:hypothetical protein
VGEPIDLTGFLQVVLVPAELVGLLTNLVQPIAVPAALSWWLYRWRASIATTPTAPLQWSPGWAACGWFVPIANLFVPYLVMRELWFSSGPARGRSILAVWWTACIVDALYFWFFFVSGSLVTTVPVDSRIVLAAANVLNIGFGLAVGITGIVAIHRLTGRLEARHRELLQLGTLDASPMQPWPRWAGGYAAIAPTSSLAIAGVVLAVATSLAMFLVGAFALFILGEPLVAVDRPVFLVWAIAVLMYVFTGLLVAPAATAVWMHNAYRNLPALGVGGLTWSPGWAAGAWFVPIANLFVPYLVARELWRGSSGGRRSFLALWWPTWLASWVLLLLAFEVYHVSAAGGDVLLMLAELALALAAVPFIRVISLLTGHQAQRSRAVGARPD